MHKPGEILTPESRAAQSMPPAGRESLQDVTDQARLSEIAPRIQAVLSEMAGSENNVLQRLADNIDRLQGGFIDTLYGVLSQGDIDLNQKMTLRLNPEGMLSVAGEHMEKEKVDTILAKNPALSAAFSEIASQSEVLRDITNINKVMTRQTGAEAYAGATQKAPFFFYQMSLKGDMSHFYFSRS